MQQFYILYLYSEFESRTEVWISHKLIYHDGNVDDVYDGEDVEDDDEDNGDRHHDIS